MRRICRDGIPAFMAAAVLLAATGLEARMVNTGRLGYRVDIIFNMLLACIAVFSIFLIGLPAKRRPERQPVGLLSNLLISILAFLMNIAVFGHEINWHAPLENLWGRHIGWLVCAILQIRIGACANIEFEYRKNLLPAERQYIHFGSCYLLPVVIMAQFKAPLNASLSILQQDFIAPHRYKFEPALIPEPLYWESGLVPVCTACKEKPMPYNS